MWKPIPDGCIMSKDYVTATVKGEIVTVIDQTHVPHYFRHHTDVRDWLEHRAIDRHRTHSRLLKKMLRISSADDAETALSVHAASVTDTYWFRVDGEDTTWDDVRFTNDIFSDLALKGSFDALNELASLSVLPPTPELAAVGSFEKCFKLEDGCWWIYKSGTPEEMFSEVFVSRLAKRLGFPAAEYQYENGYVKTKDFTENHRFCLEHIRNFTSEDMHDRIAEYFPFIHTIGKEFARDYLRIAYMDALCFNADRHDENFGFLTDPDTGKMISMAPNYDNNISLLAKECSQNRNRTNDFLIREFKELLSENADARALFASLDIPRISRQDILVLTDGIGIVTDREFVADFVENGQTELLREIG